MTVDELQAAAYSANLEIFRRGLAILTWGNASVFDAGSGLIAIKPSGVPYERLAPENMVVLRAATGEIVGDGSWRPSSDTATHRALYNAFPQIGGIVHTHSRKATAWAQAGHDIPCFGTTHADHFYGPIPCTAPMTAQEVRDGEGYEHNTGLVIVRTFRERGLDPLQVPGVLVHGHAPFAWGPDAAYAVENATVLEEVAGMALDTLAIRADTADLGPHLLDKHFLRKHGATAYYGQSERR
ncbi:MAG: L-ribulose-5-phosphate 4-epimerase AraD [Capsulimonadales bacterium]|nr:L-ribulose-5-phosphate 4-epimerase AraD [Capsulimonadales bacterium]